MAPRSMSSAPVARKAVMSRGSAPSSGRAPQRELGQRAGLLDVGSSRNGVCFAARHTASRESRPNTNARW